jgi:hypothetical protein
VKKVLLKKQSFRINNDLKNVKKVKLSIVVLILASFLPCMADQVKLSDAEINAKLMLLKPLPKIHYCWPPDANLLETRDSRRLYELARIMLDVIRFSELCAAKLRTIYE